MTEWDVVFCIRQVASDADDVTRTRYLALGNYVLTEMWRCPIWSTGHVTGNCVGHVFGFLGTTLWLLGVELLGRAGWDRHEEMCPHLTKFAVKNMFIRDLPEIYTLLIEVYNHVYRWTFSSVKYMTYKYVHPILSSYGSYYEIIYNDWSWTKQWTKPWLPQFNLCRWNPSMRLPKSSSGETCISSRALLLC